MLLLFRLLSTGPVILMQNVRICMLACFSRKVFIVPFLHFFQRTEMQEEVYIRVSSCLSLIKIQLHLFLLVWGDNCPDAGALL